MPDCNKHDQLEERVRNNEGDIREIQTNFKHLPADMKDAVEEGMKAHRVSMPESDVPGSKRRSSDADKWYKSQTALLTFMMAVITLIGKLLDKL